MRPNLPEGDIVLIVDDVPDNLAVLSDALDEAGYAVVVATSGESALERLQHVTPHAILLDAVMPGLDGFETCRRLKAEPLTRGIPVIFMTGLTETEHVVRGFMAGGTDYVAKPIRPEEVLARIGAHIRNARVATQAHAAIEALGLGVLIIDRYGEPRWQTRNAEFWLAGWDAAGALPENLARWVARQLGGSDTGKAPRLPPLTLSRDGRRLSVHYLGGIADGDHLLLLQERQDADVAASLSISYNLTPREVEVLMWVAKGKTSKDIAEILGVSPRTVAKHLEHVYVKLGVETRAAAAALAISARADPQSAWD